MWFNGPVSAPSALPPVHPPASAGLAGCPGSLLRIAQRRSALANGSDAPGSSNPSVSPSRRDARCERAQARASRNHLDPKSSVGSTMRGPNRRAMIVTMDADPAMTPDRARLRPRRRPDQGHDTRLGRRRVAVHRLARAARGPGAPRRPENRIGKRSSARHGRDLTRRTKEKSSVGSVMTNPVRFQPSPSVSVRAEFGVPLASWRVLVTGG
jgi:hypothetical protein